MKKEKSMRFEGSNEKWFNKTNGLMHINKIVSKNPSVWQSRIGGKKSAVKKSAQSA